MPFYRYPGALDPATYELENEIADPDRLLERHIEALAPWAGRVVLDIGAGSGYHAVGFARQAAQVHALEPDPLMRGQIQRRLGPRPLPNLQVLAGDAEHIPLPAASVDVAHARFAYFFGIAADCTPGLRELQRVLRPGGHAVIIDNCYDRGQFAGFCRLADGQGADLQAASEAFFRQWGFEVAHVRSSWRAPDRQALRRVLSMEFPPSIVPAMMRRVRGCTLSYVYAVYHYRQP